MCAGGGMQGQMVPYLNERFPTEVRATASAFCYHQAAIWGGFVPLVLTFLAEHFGTGLAMMMIIGTWIGCLPGPRQPSTAPKPRARYWCPIWSSLEGLEPEVIPPASGTRNMRR
jgi:SHS family lactate transporter-like MFS transporter